MKLLIVSIITIIFCSSSYGQTRTYEIELTKLAKLDYYDQDFNNQVYLKAVTNDESQVLDVYLINQTKDSILINNQDSRNIKFDREGKDIKGNWEKLYFFYRLCGTGPQIEFISKLPPNHYTWQRIPLEQINDETYDSEIRFSFSINDSLLFSNPIKANIDFFQFLRHDLNTVNIQESNKFSRFEDERSLYFKGRYYYHYQKFDPAIKIANYFLDKYPENNDVRYLLANSIVKKTDSITDLSTINKIGILSEGINLLNQIPISHKEYKNAGNLIALWKGNLFEIQDIEKILVDNCKKIGDTYECEIGSYLNKIVRIDLNK